MPDLGDPVLQGGASGFHRPPASVSSSSVYGVSLLWSRNFRSSVLCLESHVGSSSLDR